MTIRACFLRVRIPLLIFVAVLLTGCRDGYLGMSLPAEFTFFSQSSPWNTPIAPDATVNSRSDEMIDILQASLQQLTGSVEIQLAYKQWTTPIHVIHSEMAPKVAIETTDSNKALYGTVDSDCNGVAEGVPMPSAVWPDPEEDGHMTLVDPFSREVWEFSRLQRKADGGWKASIVDKWDLDGPGYREPFSGKNWWRSGAVGAGVPVVAGVIRVEEIAAGEINHAMAVALPVNRKNSDDGTFEYELCSPVASRTDGHMVGREYIPEGARLQLNPELDLATLDLAPEALTVARALQKYGAYVIDNAGGFSLRFQNLGQKTTPWETYPGLADVAKIPVDELRLLSCELRGR